MQKKLIDGDTSYIDDRYRTRSFIEGKLVEAVDMCWKFDPKERVDVFTLVQFLRGILEEEQSRSMSKNKKIGHYPNQNVEEAVQDKRRDH